MSLRTAASATRPGLWFPPGATIRDSAGQRPTSSVNMITAHDGFTLADLVSHDAKHSEDNGEANRDGTDDNRSWNCGVEGPTADNDVLALGGRHSRALLATLLLSFGIPMILGGTSSAAPGGVTTTPTARTTRSPGSTCRRWTRTCWSSPAV
jgi:pullulanase/glycogen debranching enzyme